MKRYSIALLPTILVCAASTITAEDLSQCAVFIVNDTSTITTDQQLYEKIKHSFCSKTFADSSGAEHEAMQEGVPVPVANDLLSLKMQGNIDKSNWNQWRQEFCSSDFSQFSSHFSQTQILSTFSQASAQLVKDCFEHVAGLYGTYNVLQDRKRFSFRMRYRPFADETRHFRTAKFSPQTALADCNLSRPFNSPKRSSLQKTFEVSCQWDQKQDVVLTVNSIEGDQWTFALPALLTPSVPPTAPAAYRNQCNFNVHFSKPSNQNQQDAYTCSDMPPNSPYTVSISGGLVAADGSGGPENSSVYCQLQSIQNSLDLIHTPNQLPLHQWTTFVNANVHGITTEKGAIAIGECKIGPAVTTCSDGGVNARCILRA